MSQYFDSRKLNNNNKNIHFDIDINRSNSIDILNKKQIKLFDKKLKKIGSEQLDELKNKNKIKNQDNMTNDNIKASNVLNNKLLKLKKVGLTRFIIKEDLIQRLENKKMEFFIKAYGINEAIIKNSLITKEEENLLINTNYNNSNKINYIFDTSVCNLDLDKEINIKKFYEDMPYNQNNNFSLNYISSSKYNSTLYNNEIKLIQHPSIVKNIFVDNYNSLVNKKLLTKNESKKLKKRKKEIINNNIRNKQKLGLIKPPSPKITYKNYLKILSNTITNPTMCEDIVKKAYEVRYKKMINSNENRKISKSQITLKIKSKNEKEINKKGCYALLIKINGNLIINNDEEKINLANNNNINLNETSNNFIKKLLFKIIKNARQLYLNGYLICENYKKYKHCDNVNMIYIEGSYSSIIKYENIINKRINWSSFSTNNNKLNCKIVWNGFFRQNIIKRNFKKLEFKNEIELRKFLEEKKLINYWKIIDLYR